MIPNTNAARLRNMLEHIGHLPGADDSAQGANPHETPLSAAAAIKKALSADQRETIGQLMDHTIISDEVLASIDSIVRPVGRPAAIVNKGKFTLGPPWSHFMEDPIHAIIAKALPAVGLIVLPGDKITPLAGTAFLVGERLVMTNRHVAMQFVRGIGSAAPYIRKEQKPVIDFHREAGSDKTDTSGQIAIDAVVTVLPEWDVAILHLASMPAGVAPLRLARATPSGTHREVVVIGYPGQSASPDALEQAVFGGVYDVKRVMPGQLGPMLHGPGHKAQVLSHDSSTLPGSSGSPVIDVLTGEVVGVHYDGVALVENYMVPSMDLANEPAVVQAGVQFA